MRRIAIALVVCACAAFASPALGDPVYSWSVRHGVDPDGPINAISCPTATLCVAVDGAGDVLTTADPRTGHWDLAVVDSGLGLVDVSCPAATLCVAVDGAHGVMTSTDPAGGPSAWTRTPVVSAGSLTSVACPSPTLCVATDSSGDVLSTTNPTGDAGAWHSVSADGSIGLLQISCGSTSLCVAIDGTGAVLSAEDPAGDASAWKRVPIGSNVIDIACPTSTACIAVDTAGHAFTSTSPRGDGPAWTRRQVESSDGFLTTVACGGGACVTGDSGGTLYDAVDPFSGNGWSGTITDGGRVTALACHDGDFCVTGEGSDSVGVGVPTTAVTPAPGYGSSSASATASGGSFDPPPSGASAMPTATGPGGGLAFDIDQTLQQFWHATPVEQILGEGRTSAPFYAPGEGTFTVKWYLSHKYWPSRAQPPSIAVGRAAASRNGLVTTPLGLTAYGRRLLRSTGAQLKLIASGTFRPADGDATRVRIAIEVVPTVDLCAGAPLGISCQPGIGRRTPGGRRFGKVSHRGWPSIDGVLWIVDHEGRAGSGTARRDELLGGHGSDALDGGAGDDVLWGDEWPLHNTPRQHDTLIGGTGDDWIYASHGTNDIAAGAGDDTIWAVYARRAYIDAGPGDDRIVARRGHGTIDCGAGHDTVWVPIHGYRLSHCEVVRHTHPSPFARLPA